ncbi:sensor histidine kinase [Microbacterium sp. cf332]|uniref:sensor histidine kinase n=1 Tax=Microbacterium sp. cf332 TaxID=1761804 RepID=UPI00087E8A3E|nr:histidine kinase [Microbacterium sp. cf332]SDQ76255.1 two-component system, NarL family, sensor histidine kinase DesK [Microbacterium sp. cf332]
MNDREPRPSPAPSRTALARDVVATSWYIAVSIVFFTVTALGIWGLWAFIVHTRLERPALIAVYAVGALAVLVSTVLLLIRYRADGDVGEADRPPRIRRFLSWPVLVGVAGALMLGAATLSALFTASVLATVLCLVRWGPGIRWRGVVLVEVALVVLWFAERTRIESALAGVESMTFALLVFAVALPGSIALSLWSWDVVLELDRARATESRLAATQERLRLAGELHDLQGHHLQVIALQLELAERMLERDPRAAGEQIRLARASVDAARTGTRELAGRFRGVPLPDELANAADLLRAAGLTVRLDVAPDAALAPADILGPVIRECTTNVLKHGGGAWAELRLDRDGAFWRVAFANDRGAASALGSGAGLAGISHRVGVVGGDLRTRLDDDRFAVVVTVPAGTAASVPSSRDETGGGMTR